MTTKTQTLAEFLLARIAEDEAVDRDRNRLGNPPGVRSSAWEAGTKRQLAECEAKRRIVELHPLVPSDDHDRALGCENCVQSFSWGPEVIGGPCDTLRALALPYADHPDYRDEWRP